MRFNNRSRRGFTLVELLVVTIIIAILAATILPAVNWARRRAAIASIGMETTQIAQAAAEYKSTQGDQPPDFSNRAIVERHIRTVWPRIAEDEIQAAFRVFYNSDGSINVDPAEAIVFWLDGFSDDPSRPFFGKGGPFIILPLGAGNPPNSVMSVADVMANQERNPGPFEFDRGRLTLFLDDSVSPPIFRSNDEAILHNIPPATFTDPFPVYLPEKSNHPYVYFDSRSYVNGPQFISPTYPPVGPAYANTNIKGGLRPFLSDQKRIPTPQNPFAYEWAKKDSFQVISAGLENSFGTWPTSNVAYKLYKSGGILDTNNTPNDPTDDPAISLNLNGPPTGEYWGTQIIANFSEAKTLGDRQP